MASNIRRLVIFTLISVIPSILIWLPFFFRLNSFWNIPLPQNGMATIVANYDGPLYLVAAKSFYNKDIINEFPFTLPSEYYAAHFPLFPLLIRMFAPLTGYPYSMLLVTILSSILAIYFFQKLISDYIDKKDVFWITLVFAAFPARWLIVRSVGSSEPLFIATVIASLYYFKNRNYLSAGIWGALATTTKSPGILLFIAYLLTILIPKFKETALNASAKIITKDEVNKLFSICLIPVSLIIVFIIFKIRLNDFFAYFHSGDNIHLFFPPFQIFNYTSPWVGTFWLEEILFVYLFGILGLLKLIKMKETEYSFFVGIFFLSTLFVSHRDLIRYSLPIVPFLFISFSEIITKKEFKIAMLILAIPIYLFSLSYISQNVMPISDWAPLL